MKSIYSLKLTFLLIISISCFAYGNTTPRSIIMDQIAKLDELETENQLEKKTVRKSKNFLEKSLTHQNQSRFIDDVRLNSELGDQSYHFTLLALTRLHKGSQHPRISYELQTSFKNIIDNLILAYRNITQTNLNDAKQFKAFFSCNSYLLHKAEYLFNYGNSVSSPIKKIFSFKFSWQVSQKIFKNEGFSLLRYFDHPDPFQISDGSHFLTSTFSIKNRLLKKKSRVKYVIETSEVIFQSETVFRRIDLQTEIERSSRRGRVIVPIEISWNGKDQQGEIAPSGSYQYLYFARLIREKEHHNGSVKRKVIGTSFPVTGEITVNSDNKPPTLSFTLMPQANTNQWNNTDVLITFSASDEGSGVAELDPMQVLVSEEGQNLEFISYATDFAGNGASINVSLNVDKTLPEVFLQKPVDGHITDQVRPLISGNITDGLSGIGHHSFEFFLDDVLQTGVNFIGNQFDFIPGENLTEGKHSIQIKVKDLAGNLKTFLSSFFVDLTPPSVVFTFPHDDGLINTLTPTITASLQDLGSGVDAQSIVFKLDNQIIHNFSIQDGVLSWTPSSPLHEGSHTLFLSIQDFFGRSASQTITFTIDAQHPNIQILSPLEGQNLNPGFAQLLAEITDLGSGLDLDSLNVTFNGQSVMNEIVLQSTPGGYVLLHVSSSYSANLTHQYFLSVDDFASNQSNASVSFNIDGEVPQVQFISPSQGFKTKDDILNFSVAYSDQGSGIDLSTLEVLLDGQVVYPTATLTGFQFQNTTPFAEGVHALKVTVFDFFGNQNISTLNFIVDRQGPQISFLSLAQGQVVREKVPLIEASYSDDLTSVDVDSIRILLDGIDKTAEAIIKDRYLRYQPMELNDGQHQITIQIDDELGNSTSSNLAFTFIKAETVLTWNVNPIDAGFLRPDQNSGFAKDETVDVQAIAEEGFVFSHWGDNPGLMSPNRQIIMTTSIHLTAHYKVAPTSLLADATETLFYRQEENTDVIRSLRSVLKTTGNNAVERVQDFITRHQTSLGVDLELDRFSYTKLNENALGTIVEVSQSINGIRTIGGDIKVQLNADGNLVSYLGSLYDLSNVATTPDISANDAETALLAHLGLPPSEITFTENELSIINIGRLTFKESEDVIKLTYRIVTTQIGELGEKVHFVDGFSGNVIFSYNNLKGAVEPFIYDGINTVTNPGTLIKSNTFEDPNFNQINDAPEMDNYLQNIITYYFNEHNLDDLGISGGTFTPIHSTVNFGAPNSQFAFWTGFNMLFSSEFITLDLVAHEYTHAVLDNKANLIYAYQPGAILESIADVFAVLIDSDDWTIGEDLAIGSVRSLQDPPAYGQVDHMDDFIDTTNDNGGIHVNAGILNKAAHLLSEGGIHHGILVQGIGRVELGRLYFEVLENIPATANFLDFRTALEDTAALLHGGSSSIVSSVTAAFTAVGVDASSSFLQPSPAGASPTFTGTASTINIAPVPLVSLPGGQCTYVSNFSSEKSLLWQPNQSSYQLTYFLAPSFPFGLLPPEGFNLVGETIFDLDRMAYPTPPSLDVLFSGFQTTIAQAGQQSLGVLAPGTDIAMRPAFPIAYNFLYGGPVSGTFTATASIEQRIYFNLFSPHEIVVQNNQSGEKYYGEQVTVNLRWQPNTQYADLLNGYILQIIRLGSINTIVHQANLLKNSNGYDLTVTLAQQDPGDHYVWRVIAEGGSCFSNTFRTDGSGSLVWSGGDFYVLRNQMVAPALILPEDDDSIPETTIGFVWENFAPSDVNRLEISRNSNFTDLFAAGDISANPATIVTTVSPFLNDDSEYFWRVKPITHLIDENEFVFGPTSEVRRFNNGPKNLFPLFDSGEVDSGLWSFSQNFGHDPVQKAYGTSSPVPEQFMYLNPGDECILNLTDTQTPFLYFEEHYLAINRSIIVEISPDGQNWEVLLERPGVQNCTFQRIGIDLSSHKYANAKIRFRIQAIFNDRFWFIKNIEIKEQEQPEIVMLPTQLSGQNWYLEDQWIQTLENEIEIFDPAVGCDVCTVYKKGFDVTPVQDPVLILEHAYDNRGGGSELKIEISEDGLNWDTEIYNAPPVPDGSPLYRLDKIRLNDFLNPGQTIFFIRFCARVINPNSGKPSWDIKNISLEENPFTTQIVGIPLSTNSGEWCLDRNWELSGVGLQNILGSTGASQNATSLKGYDLIGAQDPVLVFEHAYDSRGQGSELTIQISEDGFNWNTTAYLASQAPIGSPLFRFERIQLNPLLNPGQTQVYIRLSMRIINPNSGEPSWRFRSISIVENPFSLQSLGLPLSSNSEDWQFDGNWGLVSSDLQIIQTSTGIAQFATSLKGYDLTGTQDPVLVFEHAYDSRGQGSDLIIEISEDGFNWTTQIFQAPTIPIGSPLFRFEKIQLNPLLNPGQRTLFIRPSIGIINSLSGIPSWSLRGLQLKENEFDILMLSPNVLSNQASEWYFDGNWEMSPDGIRIQNTVEGANQYATFKHGFNVLNASNVELSFLHKFDTRGSGSEIFIEMSEDGITWNTQILHFSNSPDSSVFVPETISLDSFIQASQDLIFIRFGIHIINPISGIPSWELKDIRVNEN